MKKTIARNRGILVGAIILVALLVGITIPAVVPSVAATNSHSVNVSPSDIQSGMVSYTASNGTFTMTVVSPNGTAIQCEGTYTLGPNSIGSVSVHSANGSTGIYITVTLVEGSCHPANG